MSGALPEPRASRPHPRDYFMDAESGAGLLSWKHVSDALAVAKNYWVATSGGRTGHPHCMPVWGTWNEREFVFSTSPVSRKARNLATNPYASVHLESGAQGVVVEGPVRELNAEAALREFMEAYNPKYAWDFRMDQLTGGGVYAVRPRKAFAWMDSQTEAFSGTATRWIFPESEAG